MIHHTGAGPDSTRDSRPATAVEGAVRAMPSPARPPVRPGARKSRRASRNIAVALALAAFAVIMFLVTIVKFEEQIYKIDLSRPPGEPVSIGAAITYFLEMSKSKSNRFGGLVRWRFVYDGR